MIQVENGKETLLTQCEENCKCWDPCRSHGVSWAAGGSFPVHPSRRSGLASGTGLSMSNGHLCVLTAFVEGALLRGTWYFLAPVSSLCWASSWSGSSQLCGEQDCWSSWTQNKPHAAALPRANLQNPGVTTVKEPELLGLITRPDFWTFTSSMRNTKRNLIFWEKKQEFVNQSVNNACWKDPAFNGLDSLKVI